jgi:membrane associated rhomboid family serine protease
MADATATQTCYRHPRRETGVNCSNCGRPICPDCMTPTSVGMRCPECAGQTTKVRTVRNLHADPQLTYAIIAVNVLVFLGEVASGTGLFGPVAGRVYTDGALYGPLIADGDWWRIVTGGFLHASLIHIAFNMYFVYALGGLLEPAMGKLRFGILYVVSLLGGSLGALIVTPNSPTVGASGAAFGLLGAGILAMRARGIDPMQSGLGMTLILNLGISFILPGISIGGHIGGLIAGGIAGYLLFSVAERRRELAGVAMGAAVVLGVACAVASVIVARNAVGI